MSRYLLIVALLLSFTVAAARQNAPVDTASYVCPPCGNSCDDTAYAGPGNCLHCGMTLLLKTGEHKVKDDKRMTICFYLQDGVEVLDFAGPMEVFSYAGFKVFTVSKTKGPLTSQGILKFTPEYSIQDAPEADIFAVFGGNAGNASNDSSVIRWIQSRDRQTAHYFSVCTGAFILAKAGILDGLTATTFHLSIDHLKKQFPKVNVLANKRFVDNGKVITTAGISAGIDGALHLVSKLKGEDAAKQVAVYMEYDKWIPGDGFVTGK